AFPALTFDVTVKVEHVLAHEELWDEMAGAGCLFVVSAFESATDAILARLDKGHTVEDARRAVRVLRDAGIEPRPSLLPFTPWTTADDVWALLDLIAASDLVGNVDPVHYAIRLLVPPGSLLLDSGDLNGLLGGYDHEHLGWQWRSRDPRLDALQARLSALAQEIGATWDPAAVYEAVRSTSADVLDDPARRPAPPVDPTLRSALAVDARPRLTEAWFCCAEPTDSQLVAARGDVTAPAGGR
ncbi:MAG TPA: CUAEP/CCAEP-tail radical SAM protein, partial [Acidimicrobiales bacterium]|nr:CUAEP/CCAEP-tail radical SAM protein [Acidimicrobiales bacterium]